MEICIWLRHNCYVLNCFKALSENKKITSLNL